MHLLYTTRIPFLLWQIVWITLDCTCNHLKFCPKWELYKLMQNFPQLLFIIDARALYSCVTVLARKYANVIFAMWTAVFHEKFKFPCEDSLNKFRCWLAEDFVCNYFYFFSRCFFFSSIYFSLVFAFILKHNNPSNYG